MRNILYYNKYRYDNDTKKTASIGVFDVRTIRINKIKFSTGHSIIFGDYDMYNLNHTIVKVYSKK